MPHLIKTLLALIAFAIYWHQSVLNRPLAPLPAVEIPAPPAISEAVLDAAHAHRLDALVLVKLIRQESSFNPRAVSPVGAAGLTQLMPKTAQEVGVSDRFDARQSVMGGARYLRKMIDRFGRLDLGVAAYNCGGGCVEQWMKGKRTLPPETVDYVRRILGVTLAPSVSS